MGLNKEMRSNARTVFGRAAPIALLLLSAICSAILTGCGARTQTSPCLNDRKTLLDLIYRSAKTGADDLAAEGRLTRLPDVQAELRSMRTQNVLNITNETMGSLDPATGKASCQAILHFNIPETYKTPAFAQRLHEIDPLSNVAADIMADDPTATLDYTIEPDANGDGGSMVSMTAGFASDLLTPLAMVRVETAKGSY